MKSTKHSMPVKTTVRRSDSDSSTESSPRLDRGYVEDAGLHEKSSGHVPFNVQDYQLSSSELDRTEELEQEYPGFIVRISLNDARHPQNWSFNKRVLHTWAFGFTTFAAQFVASVISPGIEMIAGDFNVGREVGALVFSCYLMGNMIGPILFAPLSEISGRKVGVFIPCFFAGILMCFAASNVACLVVVRFLAGVFAAAPIVSSGGAMADMWQADHRASAMVLYSLNVVGGNSCAPVFGALLVKTGSYGWRWTLWAGGLLQMTVSFTNLLFLSETYLPTLEKALARDLRIQTGVWGLHCKLDSWRLTFREFATIHCLRPILMLFTPIQGLLTLYSSFVFGLLFLGITTVGDSFQRIYHFSFVASYCPLLAVLIGCFFGGAVNVWNSRRFARIRRRNEGRIAPEQRLPGMMFFGWAMPVGLFLYGWTIRPSIHWIVPCVGIGFMGAGLSVIFQGCLVYMVDAYTKYAASAIAAQTMVRSIFGGVFPLFALQMYHHMRVRWATTTVGIVAVAMWPMSWLFYFYGARLRTYDPFEKMLR